MVVDTNLTVAYKCPICGSYEFFQLFVFDFLNKDEISLKCKCKCSRIKILNKFGLFYFNIPCIACENNHIYKYSIKDLLSKREIVIKCKDRNIDLSVIGRDSLVRKKVDMLEKELDELIDLFGYDNYFSNTQIMFETLNIIHDIAEKEEIYCKCEKPDIDITLLSDKINVKCFSCYNYKIIYASSNEELKYTKNLKLIKLDLLKINIID
ncbi:MAG: hypothetical protein ABF289_06885 [Clostridiales bacterium]